MARQVKCPICGKMNNKEDAVESNKRYYCHKCLEDKQIEAEKYKALIADICNIFEIEAPTVLMTAQIKQMKEKYGYTYNGMRLALNYFFVLEKHSTEEANGIGIIPYIYQEMSDFYDAKKRIAKNANEMDIDNLLNNKRTITKKVKSSAIEKEKSYKESIMIDIESIVDDEDEDWITNTDGSDTNEDYNNNGLYDILNIEDE